MQSASKGAAGHYDLAILPSVLDTRHRNTADRLVVQLVPTKGESRRRLRRVFEVAYKFALACQYLSFSRA